MKLATYNVNSVRTRLPIVLDWMVKNKPDIFCLQETKVTDDAFPARDFTDAGWLVYFRGEKSYNGVAIVTRREPDEIHYGFDDGGTSDEARLIYARFGKLHVVNTYVPQGRSLDHPNFKYKLEWFARLQRFFDRHFKPDDPAIWTGDLNVAPDPIDIHNSDRQKNHVCFHSSVREAFAAAREWGWTDVFRQHHPEPGHYSYFDYRMPDSVARNVGWRIDHILATDVLARKCTDCFIDMVPRRSERPSDHTVVAAEFDITL